MVRKVNIFKILAMLMILFSVMFTLSACSTDGALPENGKSDAELAEDQRTCWQDKVLEFLYDSMGTVAMGTYKKITNGAMSLMMVAFSIWFAFRLLSFVSSVKDAAGESAEMWNEVLRKFTICFVCGILASSTDGLLWVLNMIVFPIYNAFLEFGGKVLGTTSKGDIWGNQIIEIFGEKIQAGQNIICQPQGLSYATLDGFPEAPKNMMKCMICAVNERLTLGNALAYKVMRLPGFMVTVMGFLILATFTMIKLGFVFYLVDAIFRFTMMVVLLPILIMAYAFEQTKAWTSKGFKTILSSAVFMMMIAILIAMALMAIVEIIKGNPELFNPQEENAENNFKEFNPTILALLLLAFLIKNTLSVGQSMVSSIIGEGAEAKFQKKLRAAVVMVGKAAAAWLTAGASKGVEAAMQVQKVQEAVEKAKNSHIGKAVGTVSRAYKKAQTATKNVKKKLDHLAGRDGG